MWAVQTVLLPLVAAAGLRATLAFVQERLDSDAVAQHAGQEPESCLLCWGVLSALGMALDCCSPSCNGWASVRGLPSAQGTVSP